MGGLQLTLGILAGSAWVIGELVLVVSLFRDETRLGKDAAWLLAAGILLGLAYLVVGWLQ